MKKKSALKTLLSMTAAASMLWSVGCQEETKEKTTQTNVKVEQPQKTTEQLQQERIDNIYLVMRDMPCHMTYWPYMDKGTVKIGFGTPIESADVLEKISFINDDTGLVAKQSEKKNIIQDIKNNIPSRYRTNALSIRQITKDYLKQSEKKAMRLIPNYLKLPTEIQTVVLQTDLLTNGKLETYPKFCSLVNAGRYLDAANECGIKGLKHAQYNEGRREILRHYGNQPFAQIFAQKTRTRD